MGNDKVAFMSESTITYPRALANHIVSLEFYYGTSNN
jgi:hypothetical protein